MNVADESSFVVIRHGRRHFVGFCRHRSGASRPVRPSLRAKQRVATPTEDPRPDVTPNQNPFGIDDV